VKRDRENEGLPAAIGKSNKGFQIYDDSEGPPSKSVKANNVGGIKQITGREEKSNRENTAKATPWTNQMVREREREGEIEIEIEGENEKI
jgi:hypothetical protein